MINLFNSFKVVCVSENFLKYILHCSFANVTSSLLVLQSVLTEKNSSINAFLTIQSIKHLYLITSQCLVLLNHILLDPFCKYHPTVWV